MMFGYIYTDAMYKSTEVIYIYIYLLSGRIGKMVASHA